MINTKKHLIFVLILLLSIYYIAYFSVRHSTAFTGEHFVVSMLIGPGHNNVQINIPFSIESIKENQKWREIVVEKGFPVEIMDPIHTNYLYQSRGIFENKLPIQFKFFTPAIATELLFWFVYSLIV